MDEAEAEEAGEGGGGRAAAVEAEDELVEVALQVLLAQAVIDAQGPAWRWRRCDAPRAGRGGRPWDLRPWGRA